MIGGFFVFFCTCIMSLMIYRLIKKNILCWSRWVKIRNRVILIGSLSIIPVTIYELHIGIFDNIYIGFFINSFEIFCFFIGLYVVNILSGVRSWELFNNNKKVIRKN